MSICPFAQFYLLLTFPLALIARFLTIRFHITCIQLSAMTNRGPKRTIVISVNAGYVEVLVLMAITIIMVFMVNMAMFMTMAVVVAMVSLIVTVLCSLILDSGSDGYRDCKSKNYVDHHPVKLAEVEVGTSDAKL